MGPCPSSQTDENARGTTGQMEGGRSSDSREIPTAALTASSFAEVTLQPAEHIIPSTSSPSKTQLRPDPVVASAPTMPGSATDTGSASAPASTSVVNDPNIQEPTRIHLARTDNQSQSDIKSTTISVHASGAARRQAEIDGNDQVTQERQTKPQSPTPSASTASSVSQQSLRKIQQPASTTVSATITTNARSPNPMLPSQSFPIEAGVKRPLPLPQSRMSPTPTSTRPPASTHRPIHSTAHSAVGISPLHVAHHASESHPPPAPPTANHMPGQVVMPPGVAQPGRNSLQQQHSHALQPPIIDHRSLYEEQISQQRSTLVDRYAPYIEHSDRSLKDARIRLETALGQVLKLRSAFTERVYGKYRVCLKPPDSLKESLQSINTDPHVASRNLEKQIRLIKAEKDLEKKEAQTLNTELSKMDASLLCVSADNAEQLMYISAGLSLVILPEDNVDQKLLEGYQDRAPVNPATGQRVRSISQAAAAAGEVMLERTRRGRAMRRQWQQQRPSEPGFASQDPGQDIPQQNKPSPLELLTSPTPIISPAIAALAVSRTPETVFKIESSSKGIDQGITVAEPSRSIQGSATANASMAKPLTQANPQESGQVGLTPAWSQSQSQGSEAPKNLGTGIAAPTPKTPEPSTAKFGRSRGGAGISVHVSLSLNPTADEITEKPSRASTAALLARGVGTAQGISRASPQQRLRHPHPTSAGGRQRASSATSAKKELATLTQAPVGAGGVSPQSYLHFALPPLPTPLERRERKSLLPLDASRSSSARAKKAIALVLGNLNRSQGLGNSAPLLLTKIELLHNIQKTKKASTSNGAVETSPRERPIDPTLAFSVLQTIGLITEAGHKDDNRSPAMLDEKVQNLQGEKRKLESLEELTNLWIKLAPSKKLRFSSFLLEGSQIKGGVQTPVQLVMSVAAAPVPTSPPVENLRGGGEMISDSNDDSTGTGVAQALREANARKNDQRADGPGYSNHVGNHVDSRMLTNNIAQNARQVQPNWDGQHRQGMMTSHVATNSVSIGMNHSQASVSAPVAHGYQNQQVLSNHEQYQTPSNYALHLAHQLRNAATNNMAGLSARGGLPHGEVPVANFMNNLHQSTQWSAIGTSAAMAAAQSSLAALGLAVPMGVYGSVQDRAAQALLAREQRNVAAAHAVAAHQQSMAASSAFAGGAANPGFAPTGCQTIQQRANVHSALMNSAAQSSYGIVNQSALGASMPQQQRNCAVTGSGFTRHAGNMETRPQTSVAASPAPSPWAKRKADDCLNLKPMSDPIRSSAPLANSSNPVPAKKTKQSDYTDEIKGYSQKTLKAPPSRLASGEQNPRQVVTPRKVEAMPNKAQKGMAFCTPNAPASLSSAQVELVRTGQVHVLSDSGFSKIQPQEGPEILDYLIAVATAVPIPKALILSALKDRLSIPGFKALACAAGFTMPREIVVAVILIWLWNSHEEDFQLAFAKSGRIDVDPTCKWLIHAAVDTSVRALTSYISDCEMNSGAPSSNQTDSTDAETSRGPSYGNFSSGFAAAVVVSKALTTESSIDSGTDSTLPLFHELTKFLDECRLVALHSRSKERVLLASLISLKSVMSESFAHAYVSSIVRAGDALGHEALAEIVADDDLKISSMLPYDILGDGGGSWEDPCRPVEGFNTNLTGDVLTKVAHARAIIQKSLRRLQDRHGIKAGTPTFGAYADLANGQSNAQATGSSVSSSASKSVNGFGGTPKWNKRRLSSSSEGAVPEGTGSAHATSWALYDPKHFSAPVSWNIGAPENTPYGRQRGGPPASLQGLGSNPNSTPKNNDMANGTTEVDQFGRSTHEIDWAAVAESFHGVKLPGGGVSPHASIAPSVSFKTIISPFCRQFEETPAPSEESDTEEDLSDEAVLARHQSVLDGMKEKLTAFMEARKKMVERRKKTQPTNS